MKANRTSTPAILVEWSIRKREGIEELGNIRAISRCYMGEHRKWVPVEGGEIRESTFLLFVCLKMEEMEFLITVIKRQRKRITNKGQRKEDCGGTKTLR